MIMPAGRQLLLPANPRFIAFTLILGLLLHMWLGHGMELVARCAGHRGGVLECLPTASRGGGIGFCPGFGAGRPRVGFAGAKRFVLCGAQQHRLGGSAAIIVVSAA